ncbi:MAG: iron-containing redox enzyme family protein [Pseudomonadales bacterium]|nr:iron-containing redox enzyme family protein [Pseudomonadales bacterium]
MLFYKRLLSETSSGQEYLLSAQIINDVFEGKFSLDTYVAFLNQAYHHVKHTIPLLMSAGSRLNDTHEWARLTIGEYIQEEMGHEQWILNDIEACGFDRETFEKADAPHSSEMMVAYLYDTVARKNPMGIFGMVLVLEGTSSSLAPAVAQIVREQLSLPDEAMTYLTTHGELDQDHIQFFENAMNKVTDLEDQKAIIHSANAVYRLYGDVYRSLSTAAQEIKDKRAA